MSLETPKPRYWYLVSYTAHNPHDGDTVHATQELPLDEPWAPGDLGRVTHTLNTDMVQAGYVGYTKPVIINVYYMGAFDA